MYHVQALYICMANYSLSSDIYTALIVLSLTYLMNHLLSRNAHCCLIPWLCKVPLRALLKNGGGV